MMNKKIEERISRLEDLVHYQLNIDVSCKNSNRGLESVSISTVIYAIAEYLGVDLIWEKQNPKLIVQKREKK
jgi:hypothetical protein